MESSTVILYGLVILSLIFSLTALLLVARNNDVFTPKSSSIQPTIEPTTPEYDVPSITNPPQPTPISTPQPTPLAPETELTLHYTETNRVENNDMSQVTLTINVTYTNGDPVTIDYSQFYLQLAAPRLIMYVGRGTATPHENGSFTMGPSHQKQIFQLTFEFPTMTHNGMDPGTTLYQLQYNGTATIQWENQEYH